jgi:hypothetical protein
MTDEELIARFRNRANDERTIQKNNEAVAAALMGQRLLFDQGVRSASNNFAVRLGLEHEKCAKNDASLANDWDAAANRIAELIAALAAERKKSKALVDALCKSAHQHRVIAGMDLMGASSTAYNAAREAEAALAELKGEPN